MVFFNDPVSLEKHELQAVRLALCAQERFADVAAAWRKRGVDLGIGIGIAAGYATLGRIGFEGRYDYGALGPVTNLASRLSSKAATGEILISAPVFAAVETDIDVEPAGELELKGFSRRDRGSPPGGQSRLSGRERGFHDPGGLSLTGEQRPGGAGTRTPETRPPGGFLWGWPAPLPGRSSLSLVPLRQFPSGLRVRSRNPYGSSTELSTN
jgi:Adenylate and Guanylate cyclase catalytic domain